jgi:hypothetical protein
MQVPIWDASRCICSPELDEITLIAAIDGEASPEIYEHLRQCGYCARRAQEYAELQGFLRKQFFRMFCPPTDTLVGFHEGILSTSQAEQLNSHLATCPHCKRELKFLQQLAADAISGPAPPEQWYVIPADARRQAASHHPAPPGGNGRTIIARCTQTNVSSPLFDFHGAPRSQNQISQYAFQAENLQITIGVRTVVNRADRRVLTGSLRLHDEPPASLTNTIAYLFDSHQQAAAARLDELGNFVLDNILPGTYRLSFCLPDREVIIETMTL